VFIDYFDLIKQNKSHDTFIIINSKTKATVFKLMFNDLATLNTVKLYFYINKIKSYSLIHKINYKEDEQSETQTGILAVSDRKGSFYGSDRKLKFKFNPAEYFDLNFLQLSKFNEVLEIDLLTTQKIIESLKNCTILLTFNQT
jgi:hypothetical protein